MKTQAKSKIGKIACICLAVLILISAIIPVVSFAAADDPFVLTGECIENFSLTTNREDIFNISGASPGDKYVGEILVNNNGLDTMEIAITDISSNIQDEALYDALMLKISHNGATLYSGVYGETPDPVTNFIPIKGRERTVFDIEVYFPEEEGNVLQGKKLDCTWTFEAKYYNKEKIKTGVDLTGKNPNNKLFLFVTGLSSVLLLGSLFLIVMLKKKERNTRDKERSNHG